MQGMSFGRSSGGGAKEKLGGAAKELGGLVKVRPGTRLRHSPRQRVPRGKGQQIGLTSTAPRRTG